MKAMVLVPTRSVAQAESWVRSFQPVLRAVSANALLVQMSVCEEPSQKLSTFAKYLGSADIESLLGELDGKLITDQANLFGCPCYGRSYGGASNLLLALALALDAEVYAKVDDDCVAIANTMALPSVIRRALNHADQIYYGKSVEFGTDPELLVHKDILALFQRIYRSQARMSMNTAIRHGKSEKINNGALVFNRRTISPAPYPNLYDYETGICLRGEVYFRERMLFPQDIRFTPFPKFEVGHRQPTPTDPALWAKQTFIGIVFAVSACRDGKIVPHLSHEFLTEYRDEVCNSLHQLSTIDENQKSDLVDLVANHSLRVALELMDRYSAAISAWKSYCRATSKQWGKFFSKFLT